MACLFCKIVAGEIRDAMASGEYAAVGPAVQRPVAGGENVAPPIVDQPGQPNAEDTVIAQRLLDALGGRSNLQLAEQVAVTRLRFVLRDAGKADPEALKGAGATGVMKASENVWHIIAGQRAAAIAAVLNRNVNP